MRRNTYIVVLLSILVVACTKSLNYSPHYEGSKVVLNAEWHTTDTVHYVYLCMSTLTGLQDVEDDIRIKCYLNGILACEPDASWEVKSDDSFLSRCYPLKLDLTEGDVVTITAESDSCHLTASAVVMPRPVISVDTTSVLNEAGLKDRTYSIDVSIEDDPFSDNYYQAFSIQAMAFNYYRESDTSPCDTLYSFSLIDDYDPLFKNSPIQLSDGAGMPETIKNRSHVFTDELFKGGKYTLHFSFNDHTFVLNGHSGYGRVAPELVVRMAGISKETYLYCSSSNSLNMVSGFGSLVEPTIFPENVTGGLGYFGIISVTENRILTKECVSPTRW